MPTPAERKTLLFFSMILLLGASTRAYRTLHGHSPVDARARRALEIFPSPANADRPLPREIEIGWWREAEKLAELEHVPGMGFHSARRKFANELKPTTNLRDLAYMGGWKSPITLLTVYQQPDLELQRASLAGRKKLEIVSQSRAN